MTELIAEEGSGVPGRGRRPIANESAEKVDDEADPGPLTLPSRFVKLPDLELSLASLVPLAETPPSGWAGVRSLYNGTLSWGVGVANRSCGGFGRLVGRRS